MRHRIIIAASLFLLVSMTFCVSPPASWATAKKPPLKPININTANSDELQQVPGIGPATAEKILQMRKSYGAFKTVDDLLAIKGLGRKRLDKMRKYLTVGKSAASAKPAASQPTQQSEPPT
jgi:competence protein ComEA